MSPHIKVNSLWTELHTGIKAKNHATLQDLLLVCKILSCNFETLRSGWMLLTKDNDKTFFNE